VGLRDADQVSGARTHYDARRAAGDHHNAALRNLANKLLGRLWWCLRNDEKWDDVAAWPHLLQPAQPVAAWRWLAWDVYVRTWCGFVYVPFAIDLYSRAIVGWSASTTKDVTFVEQCLTMALWRRDHTDRPVPPGMIHHSDAGSQYTSVRFTETLALHGLAASIGSVGDAYDNAAAETDFGLYKNEAVASGSPFRTGPLRHLADVEALTMHYVHWS